MTSAADLGRILDSGVAGLAFFTRWIPVAHRLGAAGSITVDTVRERYDEQRDLDLTALAVDAADLARLTASLTTCLDEQHARANGLQRGWEGRAGESARYTLGDVVARGSVLVRTVDAVARALDAAVADIAAVVGDKARVVGDFADRPVDGRTPGEIETILDGASGGSGGPTPEQVLLWFGPGDDASRTGSALDPAHVPDECTRWLREMFVPEIDAAVEAFLRVCDDTDRAINDVFDLVAMVFEFIAELDPGSAAPVGNGADATSQPSTDRVSSAPDPAARLTEAGIDLAVAAGGLATAVLDLASAALEATTVVVETVVEHGALPKKPPGVGSPEPPTPEPAPTEPVPTEPVPTEPVPTEPVPTGTGESAPESRADVPTRQDAAPIPDPIPAAVPGPVPPAGDEAREGENTPSGDRREEVDRSNPPETGVTPAIVPPTPRSRDTSTSPAPGPDGAAVREDGATDEQHDPSGGAVLAEAGPL